MSRPIVIKIITTGDGGVGKTTLLRRCIEGKFSEDTKMTIGVEFFLKELNIDGRLIAVQLWDFGGQERFRFLLKSYVLGAKGAFLMFDLTRPSTLNNLEEWVNICRTTNPKLPILFLGTKVDLVDLSGVPNEYVDELKEKFKLFDFLKISSKTGENIDLAFELLTREVLKKMP
jgi:small GTP-binding protein